MLEWPDFSAKKEPKLEERYPDLLEALKRFPNIHWYIAEGPMDGEFVFSAYADGYGYRLPEWHQTGFATEVGAVEALTLKLRKFAALSEETAP